MASKDAQKTANYSFSEKASDNRKPSPTRKMPSSFAPITVQTLRSGHVASLRSSPGSQRVVIKETLQLHSPVPLLVPHESTQGTQLMGYNVPKGTRAIVNAWAISRDPAIWEKPEEFHPERFLESEVDFRGLHFEFIPFGSGRRGCPGVGFAVAIVELVLAKLVHKFDLALPNGERGEGIDMSEVGVVTLQKRQPLLVVATPI